jgi:NADH-quinone oxidoreductase subunit M
MKNSILPLLLIILPVLGSLAVLIPGSRQGYFGRIVIRLIGGVVSIAGINALFCSKCVANYQFSLPWIESQGVTFSLALTGLALTLVTLTAIIFLYSSFAKAPESNAFWALMMFLWSSVNGVFLSTPNVLVLYIFFELMLVPIFFMIGIWGGKKRIATAVKFFLFTLLGSVPLLVTILYAWSHQLVQEGGLSLEQLQNILKDSGQYAPLLAATLILAALVKLPAVPFHGWLRSTYEESPTALLVVMSGIVGKVGLFLLIYFVQLFSPAVWSEAPKVSPVLATIGAFSILYGSMLAWRQETLKGVFTYSSLAHVGFGVLALSSPELMSLEGIVLLMIAHGLVIAPLFLMAQYVEDTFGTQSINALSGISEVLPRFSRLFFLIMLASVAVPLSGGFAAEFYILMSVVKSFPYHSAVALVGSVMGVVYMLRVYTKIMWGSPDQGSSSLSRESCGEGSSANSVAVVSIVLLLIVGLFPMQVLKKSTTTLESIAQFPFSEDVPSEMVSDMSGENQ